MCPHPSSMRPPPGEIEEYCRDLIAVAGKGGGYMFAMPQEGIVRGTKMENVRAMIDTVKRYGTYS
jgi:uroporphyrinogen-III decarboxylase